MLRPNLPTFAVLCLSASLGACASSRLDGPRTRAPSQQGALDAALTYWTYCARLKAKGYRQLVGAEDIMHALGVPGDVALIGYLFQDATVTEKPAAVAAFARASRAAKGIDVWIQRPARDGRGIEGDIFIG